MKFLQENILDRFMNIMLVLLGMYEKYCDILFLQLLQFYRVTQTLLHLFYLVTFTHLFNYVMYLYVIFFYVLLQGLQFTLKILSFSKFNFRQNFYFTKLRKFHVINVKKDIITFQSQFEMICCKLCRISSAMVVTYVTC